MKKQIFLLAGLFAIYAMGVSPYQGVAEEAESDTAVAKTEQTDSEQAEPEQAETEQEDLPRALIDGTGHGWRVMGPDDFVNANCYEDHPDHEDTWTWNEDGSLHCTGSPRGVCRSAKEYVNFEMVVEWMHLTDGGNSGFFVWSPLSTITRLGTNSGLPRGIEVQVLDAGHTPRGSSTPGNWYTAHGDVFRVGNGIRFTAFPPVGPRAGRSFPSEERSLRFNNWNHYYIRCINGEVRLWVNGKEVSGGTDISPCSGYICIESEGAPIDFRNLRIRELP